MRSVVLEPGKSGGDSLTRTMSRTSSQSSVRSIRRSVRWFTLKEYVGGALWVLPSVAALLALAVGYGISQIDVRRGSRLNWVAFQGTADDARALLIAITSTVVTVIALVLGLTVVALQLSSTQFSPRLLRNFLRDRGTQVVLSAFIATFVYSAAGLFTVGVEAGVRTETYPRLAVSGAIALLFVSLGMVVYFADHLVHSIQIDAINRKVERNTRRVIARDDTADVEEAAPQIPEWAVPLLGRRSGYIQTVYPLLLLPMVSGADVTICLRKRVGEHVVAGTVIGWAWAPSPNGPPPLPSPLKSRWTPMSGLASNAPSNKTSRSASGSRSTSAARLSLPQSTIPIPPCRRLITSVLSAATSPSGRLVPRSSTDQGAEGMSSYQETTSPITSSSSAGCLDATALPTSR
jgi:hypothetical protein